ncbi:unnamed protein product [Lactuca virosa]|uniref:FBD domain-containing protein n=1 Tax=Lactuca virosa TaxID=75947 RepID=A0AAU9LSC2_9ASTR|nr:unnamed protein product [Lactuca virosa]
MGIIFGSESQFQVVGDKHDAGDALMEKNMDRNWRDHRLLRRNDMDKNWRDHRLLILSSSERERRREQSLFWRKNGYRRLKLCDVIITAKTLQQLLTNCPILEEFIPAGCLKVPFPRDKYTILELSTCLPSVQVLKISKSCIKFGKGSMQKLPTLLVHLRILFLDVCFPRQDELSYALSVISSSPNLKKIEMESCLKYFLLGERETCKDLLDLQDYYLGMKLDHLEELEITSFHNYAQEMEFVKLIMAKSPLLKKAPVELNSSVSVDEEVKMLRDLLRLTFPRASPAVDIIIQR